MVGSWQLSPSLGSLWRLCSLPFVTLTAVKCPEIFAILPHAPPLSFGLR